MGKPSKSTTRPVPADRKIRTRSATQRKRSTDELFQGQNKPFFEDNNNPPREYLILQSKPKYFPNHEDIDIYFAPCFSPNFKTIEEPHQAFEKEPIAGKNYREIKKPTIVLPKQEIFDEGAESQVKSSLESIEEENEVENQNFVQQSQSPESPIFGRRLMKNLRTPPSKLVDLKDFDQSEEVIRRNFIDQLEDFSKDVSQPSDNRPGFSSPINQNINTIECSSPVAKTQKRISKRKKTPENNKSKRRFAEDYSSKPDEIEFSFRRNAVNDDARRRAQILRLTTLKSIFTKFEKSERTLTSLENALKSLMNYFQLRELNPKVLAFRANVYKLLKEQIETMVGLIRGKKEICSEVIQEKSKSPCEVIHYYDEKIELPELA